MSSLYVRVALSNIFNQAVSEVGMLQVLPAGCDPKEAEEGRDIVTINIVAEESLIRVLTNSYPSKGEDEEHTEGLHAFAQQMRDIVKNGKLLFARDPNLEKSIRYRAETGFSDL